MDRTVLAYPIYQRPIPAFHQEGEFAKQATEQSILEHGSVWSENSTSQPQKADVALSPSAILGGKRWWGQRALSVISRFAMPLIALYGCICFIEGIVIFPSGSLAREGSVSDTVYPGAPKQQYNYNERLQERSGTHFANKSM
jgi:hypothetical protein